MCNKVQLCICASSVRSLSMTVSKCQRIAIAVEWIWQQWNTLQAYSCPLAERNLCDQDMLWASHVNDLSNVCTRNWEVIPSSEGYTHQHFSISFPANKKMHSTTLMRNKTLHHGVCFQFIVFLRVKIHSKHWQKGLWGSKGVLWLPVASVLLQHDSATWQNENRNQPWSWSIIFSFSLLIDWLSTGWLLMADDCSHRGFMSISPHDYVYIFVTTFGWL